jgi:hypothetical protein
MRHLIFCVAALLTIQTVFAQGDFVPPPSKDDPLQLRLKPLPTGVILLPGAIPSASDSKTALPEAGTIRKNVYDNPYFGITWTFPEQWGEEFKGPPPSDTGTYVLANLTGGRASILVTAQDSFFALTPPSAKVSLPAYYKLERDREELRIGNAKFSRYDYMSPVAGLHWYVLATEIRCHVLQFVFTSQDTKVLEQLVDNLKQITLRAGNDAPRCVADYASSENIIYKVDPVLADTKFNPIPVRIIIGKSGKVRHVHVISAFASQAQNITDALMQWRFKPADVEIETGFLFGSQISRRRAPTTSALSTRD